MKIGIVYQSFSGNTKDLGEYIKESISISNENIHSIKKENDFDIEVYDILIFGTFTWGKGQLHDWTRKFIRERKEYFKDVPVFLFGTGDTQFGGDELFCKSLDTLDKILNSQIEPLKIEQHYSGSQEEKVNEWINKLLSKIKELKQS